MLTAPQTEHLKSAEPYDAEIKPKQVYTQTGIKMKAAHSRQEMDMERDMDQARSIYRDLWLQKKFCDVLITAGGAKFHGHKIILCGCSRYFKALLNSAWEPPDMHVCSIPDVSSTIMELIMEYMYTECITITKENVCELLIAADYLAVSGLVNKCCLFLKAQLCLENCIGIWRFADSYLCKNLKQQAFHFILYNFEQLVNVSKEFLDLTAEQLGEIIQNDKLNVTKEKLVFEAVLQWVEHAVEERKACLGALLPKVRMGRLPQQYFMDDVRNNALVADTEDCKQTIVRVLRGVHDLNLNSSLCSDLTLPRLPGAVLLAIGGWGSGGPTNTIQAYDSRAELWVTIPCDESPRAYHGMVYLNGFMYCIGGFDSMDYFNTVRRFDPIAKTWAETSPMHYRRCYVSACVLDERIYAMGGYDGTERMDTAERYDPKSNQWSVIASMMEQRSDAGSTALNGKIYICGGYDGTECLLTAECYSPQNNQWTLIPHMSSRRSGVGVMAYGGEVYVVGGFDGDDRLRSAEVYDPQTASWTDVTDMITQRSNFGIEVMDDLLFVVGGYDGFSTTSTVECYDKGTDTWYNIKDMTVSRSALCCCVLYDLPNMATYTAPRDVHYGFHRTYYRTDPEED